MKYASKHLERVAHVLKGLNATYKAIKTIEMDYSDDATQEQRNEAASIRRDLYEIVDRVTKLKRFQQIKQLNQ